MLRCGWSGQAAAAAQTRGQWSLSSTMIARSLICSDFTIQASTPCAAVCSRGRPGPRRFLLSSRSNHSAYSHIGANVTAASANCAVPPDRQPSGARRWSRSAPRCRPPRSAPTPPQGPPDPRPRPPPTTTPESSTRPRRGRSGSRGPRPRPFSGAHSSPRRAATAPNRPWGWALQHRIAPPVRSPHEWKPQAETAVLTPGRHLRRASPRGVVGASAGRVMGRLRRCASRSGPPCRTRCRRATRTSDGSGSRGRRRWR